MKIIKQFFKISFHAFVAFSTTSFIMILVEILLYSQIKELPEIHIGIPKSFYIFSPNEEMKYRTFLEWKYLLYDYLIFWVITFLYFQLKNFFKQKKTQTQQH